MTKTVGVFFGSRSPEHDVSILTGQLILSGLKKLNKYNLIPIYLSKKGEWLIGKELSEMDTFRKGRIDTKRFGPYLLDMDASKGKLIFQKKGVFAKQITVDIAFPAFHGQNGEDGTFQGICELLNVPYVGCDTASSALTMDKVLTKLIYKANLIPTTNFIFVEKGDWFNDKKKISTKVKELTWPLIVKPARLGSSIGISKAENQKELEFAVEVAFHYDSKVIIEECVMDLMDVTCCLIGNSRPIPSLLQESVFTSGFFSYEDKYLTGGGTQTGNDKKSIVIPARLDIKTTKDIQNAAVQIYRLLGCSGISRVDFLYDRKTKKWFANEINTLPGTLYHHLWKESGLEFNELLEKLISFAEEKYQDRQKITFTFDSSILTQASSTKLSLKSL